MSVDSVQAWLVESLSQLIQAQQLEYWPSTRADYGFSQWFRRKPKRRSFVRWDERAADSQVVAARLRAALEAANLDPDQPIVVVRIARDCPGRRRVMHQLRERSTKQVPIVVEIGPIQRLELSLVRSTTVQCGAHDTAIWLTVQF